MSRNTNRAIRLTGALAVLFAGYTTAENFEMIRQTIDGGGVTSSAGGAFELSGTIGQPDAGAMIGDNYTLTGGFWFPVAPADGNEDGAVDLMDFDLFNTCLLGPVGGLETDCNHYDADGSGHIDLRDYAALQTAFTGGS